MVFFLPSRVVDPPRPPPKRTVSGRVLGKTGPVKAEAVAVRPSMKSDCFMVL